MPTVLTQLDAAFRTAIRAAVGVDADPALSVSQSDKFGDYQSNGAMSLAKRLGESGTKTNPRAVAELVKARLELGSMASDVNIAGPGFINVRLNPAWLAERIVTVATDQRLGVDPVANPQTVVVDYSGPNVAKQMHVGHLRSTIIGDAISRVLAFQGHTVIRQNHIGDWGTQFGRVVLALWMRVMSEALGTPDWTRQQATAWRAAVDAKDVAAQADLVVAFAGTDQKYVDADPDGDKMFAQGLNRLAMDLAELETLYQYVSGITDHPAAKLAMVTHPVHGSRTVEQLPRLTTTFIQNPTAPRNQQELQAWRLSLDITLATCGAIYRRLGVLLTDADVRGESFYNDRLPAVVSDLTAAGVAGPSEGAIVAVVEGFNSPLMIRKSDGGYLYGTTDLAGVRFRASELHADRVIYTHDSRQAQHFAQVFATAKRAGWAEGVQLDYAPFGTMLGEDGKPFKTRSGDTVKLTDLLNEAEERALAVVNAKSPELPEEQKRAIAHAVGIGGVKYSDLSKDRTSDYMFSWDKMLSLEGNTGPYLQYAHARIQSIFRRATERGIDVSKRPFVAPVVLESPFELALAKHVLRFGEVVELVSRELKPHHLCAYLYELATRFSGFFENCPVLPSEGPTRDSRLTLCEAAGRTLARGLDLLGIEHPDQM
jgi:arginyl-tRNA synthetase